jgi:hypothetical protein
MQEPNSQKNIKNTINISTLINYTSSINSRVWVPFEAPKIYLLNQRILVCIVHQDESDIYNEGENHSQPHKTRSKRNNRGTEFTGISIKVLQFSIEPAQRSIEGKYVYDNTST